MKYWLFKSEPDLFSYDDLKYRPDMTEPWNGVRNYQARNYLRDEVTVGDMVLFYHSGIAEPCIPGTARVVRAGYPDSTAFDPASDSFDPGSSPDRPVWYMVDITYHAPFTKPVTRAMIKAHPLLAAMPLVRQSRLSIQPVQPHEWNIILQMGGMSFP